MIKLDRFVPREYQIPPMDAILNKGYKRALIILPRRAGKDVMAFNLLIRAALKKVGVYYYVFPTYSQAKKVIWTSITNQGVRFLDYIPSELIASTNSQEMIIRMANGSIIQLVGSDNVDSLVGTNPQGIIFSEYALQDPRAYTFLRPILVANDGFAMFISTPRGRNHMWEMYQIARESSDWFCMKLGIADTKHIPLAEIEKERAEGLISQDLIEQEYNCFTPEQLVLTHDGVKPIIDIKIDDMVISHSGRLRKVLKTMSRDYSGELIEIKSYGSADIIKCTPEHPFRVYNPSGQSYSWVEAKDLKEDDRLVFPKYSIGEYKVISYELCMLLAWYICDGSSFKNGINFTINPSKSPRIIELLDRLCINNAVYPKEKLVSIIINSVHLSDFFRESCGTFCYNKKIPLHLIMGYEDEFFHELMKGDGCYYEDDKGNSRYNFTTTSPHLTYQIQLLAHSLNRGYSAGITKRIGGTGVFPGGRICKTRDSYSIQINIYKQVIKESWMMRAKNSVAAKIISINRSNYVGKVYNLSVQYDESYVVAGRAVHNCSFELGVEGSYYGKYIDRLRRDGRIGDVPFEPGFKVHTAWDIGQRDSTVIIFFQVVGQTIRLIDCYDNSKQGLEHYAKIINQKEYNYGKHFGPHDIAVKEWGSGLTRIEKAKSLGINFTIAPNISIEDGIECVRSTFAKMWIDETKCKKLIHALENYRQEYDTKRKVYRDNPLHDWSSDFSDSLRYLCLSLPKTRDGLSAEDLDKRYKESLYGDQSNLPAVFRDDLPGY